MNLELPQYLWRYKEEIRNIFASESPARFNVEKWLEFFKYNDEILLELRFVHDRYGNYISRDDITGLAREAGNLAWPEIKRLYLAIMIWGWGNQGRGKHFTRRSLSNPRAKNILTRSFQLVLNNKVIEAYVYFNLPYCGPAYFTKYFYFVGRAYHIKPFPVILDANVAKFLEFLDVSEGSALLREFAQVSRSDKSQISSVIRYPTGYAKYIHAMDSWAEQLGCTADNVECFMYLQRDKTSHNQHPAPSKLSAQNDRKTGGLALTSSAINTSSMQWPIEIIGELYPRDEKDPLYGWEFGTREYTKMKKKKTESREVDKLPLAQYPITHKVKEEGIKVTLKYGAYQCIAAFHRYPDEARHRRHFYIGSARRLLGPQYTGLFLDFVSKLGIRVGIDTSPINVKFLFYPDLRVHIFHRSASEDEGRKCYPINSRM